HGLPRTGVWSHESALPASLSRLTQEGALRRCPQCGRHYVQTFEEEWEDMSCTQTWTLERLTPPDTLARLGESSPSANDAMLQRLRHEIGHPSQDVRAEAGVDLAAHFLAERDVPALRALLSAADVETRSRILGWAVDHKADVSSLEELLLEWVTADHA